MVEIVKGMSDTAPYAAWNNMKASVDNPSNPGYAITGAKGIDRRMFFNYTQTQDALEINRQRIKERSGK